MDAADNDQNAVVGHAFAGQNHETIEDFAREVDPVQVETQLDDGRFAIEMTAARPHRMDEALLNLTVIDGNVLYRA
jgi:hypothetical protein